MNAYQRSRQFVRLLCFCGRPQYTVGDLISRQEPWMIGLNAFDLDLLTEGEVEPYLSKVWLSAIVYGYLEIEGNATKVTSKLVQELEKIQQRQKTLQKLASVLFEDAPLEPNLLSNREEQ